MSEKFNKNYFKGEGSKYNNGYSEPDVQKHYLYFSKYVFKNLHIKNLKILEIGCAFGHGIKQANEIGILNAYGVDISDYAISSGLNKGISNLSICDLNISEINLGSFDLIFACEVLEHLDDPIKAVKKIYDAMRVGSYLYVSLPMSKKAKLTDRTHVSIFPLKYWLKNFQSNQLKVDHLFYSPICLESKFKTGFIKNFYNLLPYILKKFIDMSISSVYGLYCFVLRNHLYVVLKKIN